MSISRFEIRDSTGAVLAVAADEADAIALLRALAAGLATAEKEVTLVPVDTAGIPVRRARRIFDL